MTLCSYPNATAISMLLRVFFTISLSLAFSPIYAATPDCNYASSDPDGDGYGYENNQTCLISALSTGDAPIDAECIDHNADGWGWNGTASCNVSIPQTACVDTDPVGDGWGWDGSTSCPVGTIKDTFDEIEEIKQHFGVEPDVSWLTNKAAAVRCPATVYRSEITFYLFYDGRFKTTNDAVGAWSTGLSTTDREVLLYYSGGSTNALYLDSDIVILGNQRGTVCEWI